MNLASSPSPSDYGTLTAADTLRIQRLLPGPVERVWAFLTDGDLRRQWLAGGDMTLAEDAPFELVWRNDELTDPPGRRPQGFGEEHRMQSRITELDPPRRLAFTWGAGEVAFDLQPRGEQVLLTIVHSGISDRRNRVMIGAGWHGHLDVLDARLRGDAPEPFWDRWATLHDEYDRRVPQA
jgi:uncharacterized protein YndB with AHSA1/START domain